MKTDFEKRIKDLESIAERLTNPVIGELYVADTEMKEHVCGNWLDICKDDIVDEVDGNMRIRTPDHWCVWVKKSSIIFYDDINAKKKSFEKSLKGR